MLHGLLQTDAIAAEQYPQRPIRLLIGYPPGGAVDATGRMLAQKLGDALGQQVIVDNRSGGGFIASELVAKAAPDGYTLLFTNGQFAINPGLLKKLPYDTLKDFSAISIVTISQFVIVVHPSLVVKNIRELIALAKAKPATNGYGSRGVGSPTHLSVELLEKVLSVRTVADRDEKTTAALCAEAQGVSLHPGVRCGAHQRKALERLCPLHHASCDGQRAAAM